MFASNPFEANIPPPVGATSSPPSQNPFGSYVVSQISQESPQHAINPWGAVDSTNTLPNAADFQVYGANSPASGGNTPHSPYSSLQQAASMQSQNSMFSAQNGSTYHSPSHNVYQNPYQQPQLQYGQSAVGSTNGGNPFETASHTGNALVVAQNQTNQYVVPQPMSTNAAVVVSNYQSNPYGSYVSDFATNTQQQYGNQGNMWGTANNAVSRQNPFDPFAQSTQPPSNYPATLQSPQQNQIHQAMEFNRPQALSSGSAPDLTQSQSPVVERRMSFDAGMSVPEQVKHDESTSTAKRLESNEREQQQSFSAPRRQYDEPRKEDIPTSLRPPSYEYGHRSDVPPDDDHRESESPRNKYALELARRAPSGASPLPKADLVRKRGFVLSRISFRTIVMKKWKQSYWVQYGPHTMLWFRSQSDFDDWLNNPYHSQAERNFLIKLAVNFVHDLYKPNVRGYQVTQARTKGYGNKLVRQFKLERWMDYGPTIAAAFGSYNPKEVDDLREALVECMRNTPLDGGIRATGAVRQRPPENIQHKQSESVASSRDLSPDRSNKLQAGGYRRESFENLPADEEKEPKNAVEKAETDVDLLDVTTWDSPTQTQPAGPDTSRSIVPSPMNATFSQPQNQSFAPQYLSAGNVNMHQNQFSGQQLLTQQYPTQNQQNALVVSNQTYAYPGAPPPPTQQMQPQQHYTGGAFPHAMPQAHSNPVNPQITPPIPQQPWNQALQPQQRSPWMNQQQQHGYMQQPPF